MKSRQTHKNYPPEIISFVMWISYRDEGTAHWRFCQTSALPRAWLVQLHFHLLAYLVQWWAYFILVTPCHSPLCGKASGDACHECFTPPVITLEVSRTSQHLGWYWRVGSGTQACTQVLLAAAAVGFTSMQLRGRARSFLGAKETSPSWRCNGVQGEREMSLSGWLVWSHGWRIMFLVSHQPLITTMPTLHWVLTLWQTNSIPLHVVFCLISFNFSNVQWSDDLKNKSPFL